MRYAARVDSNHAEIIAAFRRCGWEVLDVSKLKNCCDIFVSKRFCTIAVEIKDGKKPPSERVLSIGEERFRDSWNGEYEIVLSVEDVLAINRRLARGEYTASS